MIDCHVGDPSTFQMTGTGNCAEQQPGTVVGKLEIPVACTLMIELEGFCESISADCSTLAPLEFSCFIIDPMAFDCTLALSGIVTDGVSGNFLVKSGDIALASATGVGGFASLPEAAATPLESDDSSGSAVLLTGSVAGISAALVAVIGVARYARRRRV